MRNFTILLILFFATGKAQAQEQDSSEIIMPITDLNGVKSFTYRLITQEYLNNENGYFLGVTVDTAYLKFTRTTQPLTYRMVKSRYEDKFMPVRSLDTFQKMTMEIEFYPSGKVKQLVNWKIFRDIFMSSSSAQVRAGMMTSDEFDIAKLKFNDEAYIRRLVMEDVNYLFHLCGDTFNTAIEYLRLKTIRSPFSGVDYYFQGNLKLERLAGSKNTVTFNAQNQAGPTEKPLLMEEAKAFLRKTVPKGEPVSEIKSVGLNSEQFFSYNMAQKRVMAATLSDVVTLDLSARGNIRTFDFWDIEKDR